MYVQKKWLLLWLLIFRFRHSQHIFGLCELWNQNHNHMILPENSITSSLLLSKKPIQIFFDSLSFLSLFPACTSLVLLTQGRLHGSLVLPRLQYFVSWHTTWAPALLLLPFLESFLSSTSIFITSYFVNSTAPGSHCYLSICSLILSIENGHWNPEFPDPLWNSVSGERRSYPARFSWTLSNL